MLVMFNILLCANCLFVLFYFCLNKCNRWCRRMLGSEAYANICLASYHMKIQSRFLGPGSFVSLGLSIYVFSLFYILWSLFFTLKKMLNLSVGGKWNSEKRNQFLNLLFLGQFENNFCILVCPCDLVVFTLLG
jgi:hypothetical protein